MKSHVSKQFLKLLANLPPEVQRQAHEAYRQFKQDPNHPGLNFERIQSRPNTYSVRVTKDYRVLGTMRKGEMYWYWIGGHAEYDKLINP
jgi:mRNA-degrading endonuclease RelE of RelBE toxin-antitoxin system